MARAASGGDHDAMETRDHATTTTDTTAAHSEDRRGAPRRMKRSRSDRMLGGVCAGIAGYFGIDPVIVRIATIALVAAGGVGAVTYVAAWILMPREDEPAAPVTAAPRPVAA
jgi:phage shock protein PspC (stress-responsive transcriptional regulator)